MNGRDVLLVILGAVVGDLLVLGAALIADWIREKDRRWRR